MTIDQLKARPHFPKTTYTSILRSFLIDVKAEDHAKRSLTPSLTNDHTGSTARNSPIVYIAFNVFKLFVYIKQIIMSQIVLVGNNPINNYIGKKHNSLIRTHGPSAQHKSGNKVKSCMQNLHQMVSTFLFHNFATRWICIEIWNRNDLF